MLYGRLRRVGARVDDVVAGELRGVRVELCEELLRKGQLGHGGGRACAVVASEPFERHSESRGPGPSFFPRGSRPLWAGGEAFDAGRGKRW